MLRGLAAVAVCLFHFNFVDGLLPAGFFRDEMVAKGNAGVHLFFLISGFIIPYSMYRKGYVLKNIGVFLAKRALRIEPPYLLSIAFVIAISYAATLVPAYTGKPYTVNVTGLLLHLGYLAGVFGKEWIDPAYWTLFVEFQFYLFTALLFSFIAHKNRYLALLPFLALLLLHYLQNYINHGLEGAWFMDLVYYCWVFYAGIFLFRYVCGLSQGTETLVLITFCLLMDYREQNMASLVMAAFGAWAIIFLKSKWVVTDFLGKISYSLYLTHHSVGMRFLNLSMRLQPNVAGRLMLFFADLLFCILIAWIFYLVIEKPSLQWAEKLRYRDIEPAKEN